MGANEVIGPGRLLLDEVLDEIESLARVEEARHLVVVSVYPGEDEQVIQAKRLAAIERLGLHPASIDFAAHVRSRSTPPAAKFPALRVASRAVARFDGVQMYYRLA